MGITVWAVVAICVVALVAAGFHLARPSGTTMATAIICVAIAAAFGLLGTVLGMRQAYAATAHAMPSQKAALLAEGISQAMNCTAFALGAVILWIPPFVIGEVRRRRAQPPAASPPGLRIEP